MDDRFVPQALFDERKSDSVTFFADTAAAALGGATRYLLDHPDWRVLLVGYRREVVEGVDGHIFTLLRDAR